MHFIYSRELYSLMCALRIGCAFKMYSLLNEFSLDFNYTIKLSIIHPNFKLCILKTLQLVHMLRVIEPFT